MSKIDYSKLLGCKFYKTIDGIFYTIRVISFVNPTTARIWDYKTNSTRKIKFEDLVREYAMLTPMGLVLFAGVSMPQNTKDVIVSLFKTTGDDIDIPYCICRQNIIDFHSQMIDPQKLMVGCCISEETTPEGIDYTDVRACNEILFSTTVMVYLDDTLDDILQCVYKENKYDEIIMDLFNKNIEKLKIEYLKKEAMESKTYGGYCRNLRDLLIDNEFMYDFRRCFSIATFINIEPFENAEENFVSLSEDDIEILSKEYGFWLNNAQAIKYDYDINVSEINSDVVFICVGKTEDIYIVAYDKGNKYIQDNSEDNELARLKELVKE